MSTPVTVHVRMNARIFRRFAMYDTFCLKRRFIAPALFAAILVAFAAAAFVLTSNSQASMIGNLLLIIGLGLPLAYVLHFLLQIHDQCKRLGLKHLRPAYTLNMHEKELRIINDINPEPEVTLSWHSLHGVWRSEFAFYIYANPSRAFIVPDGQYAPTPAQMYDFLYQRLPAGKMHGKRPKA
ncbi:MAG: hypothetical protein IJ381_07375 [Clostridia bacterium]|nr:hypothetical protein [Clostridia bacterium]